MTPLLIIFGNPKTRVRVHSEDCRCRWCEYGRDLDAKAAPADAIIARWKKRTGAA